jgi:putative endonuclease
MATNRARTDAPADLRKPLGRLGEELAAEHLERLGWQIVARNWRTRRGEIDIVAHDGDWLVFVEVRTRRASRTGGDPFLGRPEDSVTPKKQLKLVRMAEAYLYAMPWRGSWRVDVLALELGADDTVHRLAHFRDAVGG